MCYAVSPHIEMSVSMFRRFSWCSNHPPTHPPTHTHSPWASISDLQHSWLDRPNIRQYPLPSSPRSQLFTMHSVSKTWQGARPCLRGERNEEASIRSASPGRCEQDFLSLRKEIEMGTHICYPNVNFRARHVVTVIRLSVWGIRHSRKMAHKTGNLTWYL